MRSGPPEPVGAGAALLVVGTATAALLWLAKPYTAVLLVLPLHLWLGRRRASTSCPSASSAGLRWLVSAGPSRGAGIALLCLELHVEPLALLWTLLLMIAGGALSAWGLLLASLTAGCFAAAATILLRAATLGGSAPLEVTVRGPLSYAGPGSLGGTESALRR